MDQTVWMGKAVDLAVENVLSNHGGPFGAIVLKDGKIIGTGRNEVTTKNDPTAHAEVQAIREACQNLGSFQLTGCELYTSCEPCPMCLGAIFWARPDKVYFGYTKEDAAKAGFDDDFIYQQIKLPYEQRAIPFYRVSPEREKGPFEAWKESANRVDY